MRETPLHAWHVMSGARMVDFAGWEMPLQYTSIAEEHVNVRKRVGIFDVSHMGDILIEGSSALELLSRLITNDPTSMPIGKGIYGHMLNTDGRIIDDVIAYRMRDDAFLVVPNASKKDAVLDWVHLNKTDGTVTDLTDRIACIAVQGPRAVTVLQRIVRDDLAKVKRFHFILADISIDGRAGGSVTGLVPMPLDGPSTGPGGETQRKLGIIGDRVMLSRTGYTGEDGFEVLCDRSHAIAVWDLIMRAGATDGIVPAGLGARDTLRLEMGYLLSGTDFDGSQSTVQTGPLWAVKWDHEFIGKDALRVDQARGLPVLVGLELEERGIPRYGYPILREGAEIGTVTSGTLSPCLKKGIALGYVPQRSSAVGTELEIAIRAMHVPAHVVRPPFMRK